MAGELFFRWENGDLLLRVLGSPGASRDAIGKPRGDELKISVACAPEDGKATRAMVRYLAIQFGVAVADVEVVRGETSVHKLLRIRAPRRIPPVLAPWLQSG